MKLSIVAGKNLFPQNNNLSCCINDANDFSALLTERGFVVHKMLDWEATKDNFVAAIKAAAAKAVPNDKVVIYCSMHGTKDTQNGKDIEGLCFTNKYKDWDILWDFEILKLISLFKQGVMLEIYLDTCFAGGATKAILGSNEPKTKYVQFATMGVESPLLPRLKELPTFVSIIRHTAVDGDHTALDGAYDSKTKKGNGYYTQFLIPTIRTFKAGHYPIFAEIKKKMGKTQVPMLFVDKKKVMLTHYNTAPC